MTALDPAAVDAMLDRARGDVDEHGLPSCQIALIREEDAEVFEAFGDATADHRYVVFSVSKALTAGAAWVLFGDGVLSPDTRVAELIPEFAENGKAAVTVEHLLSHSAGFPRAPMRPLEGADRAARVARLATWRLDWEPGTRTEYHPSSADWVLGEVIERASGRGLGELIGERITGPLGIPRLRMGERPEDQGDILDAVVVGELSEQTRIALDSVGASETLAETRQDHLLRFNDPAVRAAGVPGVGAVGNALDVARYFRAMLRNDGTVWDRDVLAEATGTVRNDHVDPWTRVTANRTLGLRVAGGDGAAVLRGFGQGVGRRAFGASGVGGQVAWADPDSGLVFCYLTNGLDADPVRSFRRQAALSALAAACAG